MLVAEQVEAAVAACIARFGRIDILVNNVGGSAPGGPVDMAEEAWDAQIDLNLKTAFLGCKYVLPHMEAQGRGAVVNLSSVAGLRMGTGRVHSAYSASKAGIIAFSKSVAMGYAKKGIRCNTVVPGLMHTPLVEHRLVRQLGANDAEALIARRNASVPMGHMGTGWDIAHAVLFLVSDEAKYITATEIVVDGGFTAAGPGLMRRRGLLAAPALLLAPAARAQAWPIAPDHADRRLAGRRRHRFRRAPDRRNRWASGSASR